MKLRVVRHLEHQAQRGAHKQHTRTTVAYERQRNALQGQQSYHSTNVYYRLRTQPCQNPGHDQPTKHIWSALKYQP